MTAMMMKDEKKVTVHFDGTDSMLVDIPLTQMITFFGCPGGLSSERVVEAWVKNGEWHFAVKENEVD